jgi:spore maturation protein CgeB
MIRQYLLINDRKFYPPLQRSLEARGLKVIRDNWAPDISQLNEMLACFVNFYDCLKHPLRVWRLHRRLRHFGVPLVAWNRDAPHYLNRKPWRLDLLDRARLLDIYATHTLIDTSRKFAKTVLYLPNGVDDGLYSIKGNVDDTMKRLREPEQYQWDVSFFGAMDGSRYKEMQPREAFFSALGERLSRKNIRFLFREASGMSVDEQIALIQTSRISLNFGASCEYGAPVASGLPERCYGIPACGGFLLCDRRAHARDDFTPGENWAEFDGIDDCVEKIEYWLAHFGAARDIAERCHQHVMAHHAYRHRAAALHEALLTWHKNTE